MEHTDRQMGWMNDKYRYCKNKGHKHRNESEKHDVGSLLELPILPEVANIAGLFRRFNLAFQGCQVRGKVHLSKTNIYFSLVITTLQYAY